MSSTIKYDTKDASRLYYGKNNRDNNFIEDSNTKVGFSTPQCLTTKVNMHADYSSTVVLKV